MARAPQLVAVGLALVLVLGAAGYGIVRGVTADSEAPPAAETRWRSAPPCRSQTARLPVLDSLTLPTQLPEGVCLSTAYYSEGAPGTLWYDNEQGDKVFLITFFETAAYPSSATSSGTPIQLGNVSGYVTDETNQGATGAYTISFERNGWTYYVGARLGESAGSSGPENKVTPDELKAAALSIAQQ
jgi:hypothetical protein